MSRPDIEGLKQSKFAPWSPVRELLDYVQALEAAVVFLSQFYDDWPASPTERTYVNEVVMPLRDAIPDASATTAPTTPQ